MYHKKYSVRIVAIVAWMSIISLLTGCAGKAFRDTKEKIFSEDYETLALVADYLADLEHENVYIPSLADGEMSVSGKTYCIDNDDIVKAIALLGESGYSVITKDDGIIDFVYWSTLDAGRGFAYSFNGSKPQLQFQTYLEELPTENWFYYEEDFNLWRLNNQ